MMEPRAWAMHEAVGRGTATGVDDAASPAETAGAPTLRIDDELLLSPISADLPPPEHAWPPGTRVGRYVLGRCIGAGGLGLVFAGFDPRLGRAYSCLPGIFFPMGIVLVIISAFWKSSWP